MSGTGLRSGALASVAGVLLAACAARPAAPPEDGARDDVERARLAFLEANRVLHAFLIGVQADSLDGLLSAEERLGRAERREIVEHTERGEALAARAVEREPDRAQAHLWLAANLALQALAKGRGQTLLEGIPGRFRAACARAIELDPAAAHAGALRLQGKFDMTAPWPVGDLDAAGEALARAVELAPVSENLLMLGDWAARQERWDEAERLWRRAARRENAAGDDPVHEARVRELAARRLAFRAQRSR